MIVRPAKRLRGRVRVPGDKSVSHRAALLAALARGRTRVENFASSDDCASTLRCLAALGVRVERGGTTITVEGVGRGAGAWDFVRPAGPLDCGNSGTTMRLLAGVLAAQGFDATLTGDESLSRRPMGRVVEPLAAMGARLAAEGGRAPLRIEGRQPLSAVEYETRVPSAQVKSCVLLAGLGAEGQTRVWEREPTRDHTERMLRWFGAPVETGRAERDGRPAFYAALKGPAALAARDVKVPGDISSAAFLVAAASMLEGSELVVERVGLNPTRAGVLEAFRTLGADVRWEAAGETGHEPAGDLRVRGGISEGGAGGARAASVLRGGAVARMIDELPILAVFGARAAGGLEIRDAGELRVKESDRIGAVVGNLRAMGAEVEEFDDGLRVRGPAELRGARLDSFGDHRIAMAFAVAALAARGESEIVGAEQCVGVSFPEFFGLLEELAER
ncbi:MAG TPA: 3-phosphoshikimate 1-carboxyvinyltransferase [Pyrinomonadaceae bacterium]|nr:3-phosphoshikimate 1-carboxyvinyltransferase [Pyrinomonadaceae bacterium]